MKTLSPMRFLKNEKRINLLVCLSWILVQLPFVTSAFRIDDTHIVELTKQISREPFDPYGYTYNWHGKSEQVFDIQTNPVLVPAYLALWGRVFPLNEVSLHIAMLPFSLLALSSFMRLARNCNVDSVPAAVLLCASPAFFLGSQVLTMDIAMLAFFLMAISHAVIYSEGGNRLTLVLASLASFLCPLAKYNGVVLIPILALLCIVCRHRKSLILVASMPILSLLLWNTFTWLKYGKPHFLSIAAYQRSSLGTQHLILTLGVLSAIGLGVLPLATIVSALRICFARGLIALTSMSLFLGLWWMAATFLYGIVPALMLALSITVAIVLIGIALDAGWIGIKTRDSRSLLLVAWIMCGLFFQGGLMFSSVRYALFLAPAFILLILCQSGRVTRQKSTPVSMLMLSLVWVIAVAIGDRNIANMYRDFVSEEVAPLVKSNRVRFYFDGHWGFQYYAEKIGGEAIDVSKPQHFNPGDVLAIAGNPWPSFPVERMESTPTALSRTIQRNPGWLIRTIDCHSAANFYGNAMGNCEYFTLLPFGFSGQPGETFHLYVFK